MHNESLSNLTHDHAFLGARHNEKERRTWVVERIRDGLQELITAFPGHGRAVDCPILQALGYQESP